MLSVDFFFETGNPLVSNLRFLANWSRDISCDWFTQYLYFKMLRTISSLGVPNFDLASSSTYAGVIANQFPQVNPLVPGL